MNNLEKIVEDTAVELLRIAATELPVEYAQEMEKALKETKGSVGKSQLSNIIENVKMAREGSRPHTLLWPGLADWDVRLQYIWLAPEWVRLQSSMAKPSSSPTSTARYCTGTRTSGLIRPFPLQIS